MRCIGEQVPDREDQHAASHAQVAVVPILALGRDDGMLR